MAKKSPPAKPRETIDFKELNGTFGGRVEQIGGGRFRYVAYTD